MADPVIQFEDSGFPETSDLIGKFIRIRLPDGTQPDEYPGENIKDLALCMNHDLDVGAGYMGGDINIAEFIWTADLKTAKINTYLIALRKRHPGMTVSVHNKTMFVM